MEIFHGYELETDWRNSNCGKTAIGRKGGKRYFIKKYLKCVRPINNGTLDAKTIAHNQKLFDEFVSRRKAINREIRRFALSGGNIIIPCEEFVEGNNYCEAAELVPNVVPDEEILDTLAFLSLDDKLLLMKTAAGVLQCLQSKGIVHSDLKLPNVLLVRKPSIAGWDKVAYVAKVIDFDSSYFVTDKPDEITGDIVFFSPELARYGNSEDDEERAVLREKLTEKSDIFSLGLLFHIYLTGELPTPATLTDQLRKRKEKGRPIYCWSVLLSDCQLKLSDSIDNPALASLIRDMLSLAPEDRPTASLVLQRLNNIRVVIGETWPEHGITLDKDTMKKDGVAGLTKKKVEGQKKYELLYKDGRTAILTIEDLVAKKYVEAELPSGFCAPWDEHEIVFDLDQIRSAGFVASKQTVLNGVKGYTFYKSNTSSRFINRSNLLLLKFAKKKTAAPPVIKVEPGFCEPWSEHAIEFDPAAIKAKGFIRSEQKTLNGIHGYTFYKTDGTQQFIKVDTILLLIMARKR